MNGLVDYIRSQQDRRRRPQALNGYPALAARMSMSNGQNGNGAAKLLGKPMLGKYRHSGTSMMFGSVFGGWGQFQPHWVDIMKRDAQVNLCLAFRKAPLSGAKFMVNCQDPREKAYVEAAYQRFWRKSLRVALRAYEYGYCPAEVLYKQKGGFILFDRLKAVHPRDAVPFTVDGQLAYVQVQVPNGGPVNLDGATAQMPGKAFWLAHDQDWNPWFGHSILEAAWVPWRMKTMPGGAQETLFKWAYKFSITPLEVRHPTGTTETEDEPDGVDNQEIALQMAEQIKNGGCIALPSENYMSDLGGGKKWEITWSKVEGNNTALLEYADWLDKQIQRAMGIPDEVVTFDGGAGSRARSKVAVGAFYDGAEDSLHHIMESFDEQICRPACRLNGFRGDYTVDSLPLLPPDQEQGQMGQPGMPGQPPAAGQPGDQEQMQGGGDGSDWISRIGKRGGKQLFNPQTGAVKYGNMSLSGREAKLFMTTYKHTRKLMKRSQRNGQPVDLSRGPDRDMLNGFVTELSRAMNQEQGPRIVVNVPELKQPVIENVINVTATTPDVHIYPEIKVDVPPAAQPLVLQPDRKPEPDKEIKIERNAEGNITGAKVIAKKL